MVRYQIFSLNIPQLRILQQYKVADLKFCKFPANLPNFHYILHVKYERKKWKFRQTVKTMLFKICNIAW